MKWYVMMLCVLGVTPYASAFNYEYSYGFDGVLSDSFLPVASVSDLSFEQANQQLELHSFNLVPFDSGEAYAHNLVLPQYNESWVAHVDISVPAVYESTVPTASDSRLEVGLGVGFGPNAMASGNLATITLGVEGTLNGARRYIDASVAGAGDLDAIDMVTDQERIRVTLEYDANGNTLRARHSAQQPLGLSSSTQIDWGMGPTDTFELFLFGNSQSQPVFSSAPLTLDDFELKINRVPEPAACLSLAALVILGLLTYRRRLER